MILNPNIIREEVSPSMRFHDVLDRGDHFGGGRDVWLLAHSKTDRKVVRSESLKYKKVEPKTLQRTPQNKIKIQNNQKERPEI